MNRIIDTLLNKWYKLPKFYKKLDRQEALTIRKLNKIDKISFSHYHFDYESHNPLDYFESHSSVTVYYRVISEQKWIENFRMFGPGGYQI